MTQEQVKEALEMIESNKETIIETIRQKREFFGEASDARNKFMLGYCLTDKENVLLCEYIRKLEQMTGLEFLQ